MQVEASNHRKRLWSKAMVVSVTEKAERGLCQVSVMETNTSESLIKCRKRREATKTREVSLTWDKSGRNLFTDQTVTGMKAT